MLREVAEQLGLFRIFRQYLRDGFDAELDAHLLLHPNVHFGGRVFANAQEREAGLDDPLCQEGDALRGFDVDLSRDGSPVDKIGERHQGARRSVSTTIIGVLVQRRSMNSSPVTSTLRPGKLSRI